MTCFLYCGSLNHTPRDPAFHVCDVGRLDRLRSFLRVCVQNCNARATTVLFSISNLKIEILDTHAEEAAQSVKAANITYMEGRVPWSMIETPTVQKASHV